MGIAEDLIVIILIGLGMGLIAFKLRIPPIIGYIIAGIIIGPSTGGITVSDVHRIELLAEIGVALLLFSIGLDFSLRELKAVRGIALIGTPIQILLLIGLGLLLGRWLGFSQTQSLVLGMVISLSSTMVVLKVLMARGLIGTLSSKVMIGILIIQDLAAIPMMLIIPNLENLSSQWTDLLLVLGKAALILLLIIFVGARFIPWLLKQVALLGSRELFLISITAVGLGVGLLTHAFGLSLAFGAFVAGMVISESDYSHQALTDIIPLRDIFGLVFFTSVGMLLDPVFIQEHAWEILALVLMVTMAKIVVFATMSVSFKYFNIMPLALGFGLAQIGEFSFVLARAALKGKVIDAEFFSLLLSVSVITMIASPFLSSLTGRLYNLKQRYLKHETFETHNVPAEGLRDHIIIAGGGGMGFQVGSMLMGMDLSFVLVEQDFRRYERAKEAGLPVVFGDVGQETVLEAAEVSKARLLIIALPFLPTIRQIMEVVGKHNPGLKTVATCDDPENAFELMGLNIFEIVQPETEASLELMRQAMLLLEFPAEKIDEFRDIHRMRRQDPV